MRPSLRAAAATVSVAVVCGLVAVRAWTHPVDTYGDSGAGYIEHLERIRVLHRLQQSGGSLLDRLRAADGLYPPGLHLLSAPASLVGEHQPSAVTILGVLWLLLLAAAVGSVARSLDPRAALPAFVATLLTPALHAVAPRYYYDLPMTTLIWLAVAALSRSDRAPLRSGVVAAGTFALACGVKWSALPLGLSVVLGGALVAASRDRRAALVSTTVFGLTAAILVVPAIVHSSSFGAMGGATFQPPPGVPLPGWSSLLDTFRPGLGHALGSMALQATHDGPMRIGFYLQRLGTTLLAPILVPTTLIGVFSWLRAAAPGAAGLAVAAIPVLLFVLFAVPPLDERFLLTLLPVVPLVVGLGLSGPGRFLRLVGTLSVVAATLVAVDFHTGPSHSDPPTEASTGHRLPLRWGLSTSIDRRGWARASDLPNHQEALRADLLSRIRQCDAIELTGDDLLISERGDLNWWTFELERDRLVTGEPLRVFRPLGSDLHPSDRAPDLAITRTSASPLPELEPVPSPLPVFIWARPGVCPSAAATDTPPR